MNIENKKTIEYLIDRVKESKYAEKIVLCTTELDEDAVLCDIAINNNIEYFRGSSPDKLKRWNGACEQFGIDFFVNADGDDIFFDAGLADLCFEQCRESKNNVDFIDGRGFYNDVYGIKATALSEVCQVKSDVDTEFIRPHFVNPERNFVTAILENVPDKYHKKNIRMTLDYEEDFAFFEAVIKHFLNTGDKMKFENILTFLESNPDVISLNWFREDAWKENQRQMIERVVV